MDYKNEGNVVGRRAPYVLQKLLNQYRPNGSTLSLFLLRAIALPSFFTCLFPARLSSMRAMTVSYSTSNPWYLAQCLEHSGYSVNVK